MHLFCKLQYLISICNDHTGPVAQCLLSITGSWTVMAQEKAWPSLWIRGLRLTKTALRGWFTDKQRERNVQMQRWTAHLVCELNYSAGDYNYSGAS